MSENLSNPTAIQQRKKFLKFLDALSNKYPPMTFQEYLDADGNHTNWFPQRYEQSTASMYQQWFTCAVLNNLRFIVLVYKQRDRDATKIFTEIINNADFRNAINPFDWCGRNREMISRCVTFPLQKHGRVKINYNWDFDISTLLAYFNALFQHGNINSVSANIRICNKLNSMTNDNIDVESSFGSETEYFIYDARNKHAAPLCSGEDYISVTDIDNMYMIQVKSNSTIEFIYLVTECYDGMERDFKVLDPTATLSLLMKNIAAILNN